MDFIRQNAPIITVTAAFIIFLLTQWITKRRAVKDFAVGVLIDSTLVRKSKRVTDIVEVLYNGEVVENVRLIEVILSNTGSLPIEEKDFAVPASVEFSDNDKVLEAEVKEAYPSTLKPKIITDSTQITLQPSLFNRGDYVIIKALVSTEEGGPAFSGRISGVPTFSSYKPKRERIESNIQRFFQVALLFVCITFTVSTFVTPNPQSEYQKAKLRFNTDYQRFLSDLRNAQTIQKIKSIQPPVMPVEPQQAYSTALFFYCIVLVLFLLQSFRGWLARLIVKSEY